MTRCLSSPPPLLRVTTNLRPGNETFYLARNKGDYDRVPIRWVDYPSGTEEVLAYRNSDVEAASISMERALALASTASDFRIILVVDTSYGGDAILGQPEVRDFNSLKNKRIGVESTSLGAFVLSRVLDKEGISPKKIEIVSLQTHEQQRTFEEKKIRFSQRNAPAPLRRKPASPEPARAILIRWDSTTGSNDGPAKISRSHTRSGSLI